jgi:hypothetical protein
MKKIIFIAIIILSFSSAFSSIVCSITEVKWDYDANWQPKVFIVLNTNIPGGTVNYMFMNPDSKKAILALFMVAYSNGKQIRIESIDPSGNIDAAWVPKIQFLNN